MKILLTLFLCICVAACQTTQEATLPQDSTLPMTRIEAKNAACVLGDGNSPELCSCIASELYDYSQSTYFKKEIATAVMCESSETPRQDAINTKQFYAVYTCKNLPIPLVQPDSCWDGSIIFTTKYPCAKCPPEPTP